MGTVTVDQAKLVLNTFVTVLKNNLVTRDCVEWNEHDAEMDDRNGLQVVEQVTPRYNVTRTENGVKDLSSGTDGTVFGSELFEVTGTFNANMGWGDFIKIRDIGQARESKALMGAATSLAEKIDAYVMEVACLASNNWTGSVGASISDHIDAVAAYTRLKEEGVSDNELRYIMNYTDKMLLGDQVANLSAPGSMAETAYRKGFSGEINGIPTMFTNQLPVLTVGSRAASGAAQVNGGAQGSNYADVAKSTSQGYFMTQTIAVNNMTGTNTLKAGEVFTIAGVFAYDNRKQALVQPARLQQFTVVEDATASSGAIAAVRIFPAIIVPGSGSGDNVNINTAHATVDSVPANGAAITFLGTASTAYSPRLLIQKEAIVVNTVPLIMPATGIAMRKRLNGIPLTVRMWQHSDFDTGAHNVRFDVAMNANVRDRRKLARFNGS
jgi:hypothetical protein